MRSSNVRVAAAEVADEAVVDFAVAEFVHAVVPTEPARPRRAQRKGLKLGADGFLTLTGDYTTQGGRGPGSTVIKNCGGSPCYIVGAWTGLADATAAGAAGDAGAVLLPEPVAPEHVEAAAQLAEPAEHGAQRPLPQQGDDAERQAHDLDSRPGENSRGDDLEVNPVKEKKLTNIRAAGKDEALLLIPPRRMSLEQAIAYIEDDELVEVTPSAVRLRKRHLDPHDRKRTGRKAEGLPVKGEAA